jgi:hypothetical protein
MAGATSGATGSNQANGLPNVRDAVPRVGRGAPRDGSSPPEGERVCGQLAGGAECPCVGVSGAPGAFVE